MVRRKEVWKRAAVQLTHSSWAWLKCFEPAQKADNGTGKDGVAASLHQLPIEYLWSIPHGSLHLLYQGIHPLGHRWFSSDGGKKHFTSLKGPSALLEQTLQGPQWHSALWSGFWAGYAAYIGHSQKREKVLMLQRPEAVSWASCEVAFFGLPHVSIIAGHCSPSQRHLLKPSDLCLEVGADLRKGY